MKKRALVTVVGLDRIGIIAEVGALLAEQGLNIVDIRQTVMNEFFTMIMIVDLTQSGKSISELHQVFTSFGEQRSLQLTIQSEELFHAMHRI